MKIACREQQEYADIKESITVLHRSALIGAMVCFGIFVWALVQLASIGAAS